MKNKNIKYSFLFILVMSAFFVSCQKQEVENDYRNDSNINQSIDIVNYYLPILKEDFDYGISVAEEIEQAWEDAINIYGLNWYRAFNNLYLPTLFDRNKFTYKAYHLSGEEIMDFIDMQKDYIPDQIKIYDDLYDLFLDVKNMVKNPTGSLVSYREQITNTKKNFSELYKKLETEMPGKKEIIIEEISEKEKEKKKVSPSSNFYGITKGTPKDKVKEILTSNNLTFEEKENKFYLKDITYYGLKWDDINIIIASDTVKYLEFEYSELDWHTYDVITAVGEYHDVIKTQFFNNFYYVSSTFEDPSTIGTGSFTSLYRDKYGNIIQLKRNGNVRNNTMSIFIY